MKQTQSVNIHVPVTMTSYSWTGNLLLPRNKTYTLYVNYPLQKPAYFNIKTGKNGLNAIQLIGKIGKIYKKIYEVDDFNSEKYRVYGHDISDLTIGGIKVNHKTKKITLIMGS
jgi:hypothetical protein